MNLVGIDEASLAINKSVRLRVILVRNIIPFYKPLRWLTWLIQVATKNKFHHLAIEFISLDGSRYVMQSVGSGVIVEKYHDWFLREKRELKFFDWQKSDIKIKNRMISCLTSSYDFLIYPLWIFNYFKKYKKPKQPFYCFELAAYIFDLTSNRWDANQIEKNFTESKNYF